ncbi:hypothetical protein PFHG_01898 [Plasmodium falciparum HB3]|uniref:Uncharacterized protein n=14 Tax=Plasmodium falciparum TaxID=5833 RepID=Q8II84_PLAF7|nr:conserved Plasmodium protein, unknown function [Plasmodium falciparum 3D7]ETW35805.1 hypothetical protein PFTANZ_03398 [Plasmodium falciparum Tanzania (2000708)]ETW42051.1 hypothetical protein PFNF135_03549 [Plasmodium falciparum NF135/5.C10]ETW60639.1 hypothetical protein PFMC_03340 [Plasmodium falciparum CAMP/Malaysia]EUR70228.1 hypothetical protein PFBG_03456 [Plasmodium falciparum 7G8]KAF4330950.1 hypothetical protein CYL21_0438 [Plasmodium falciparum NF54]KOB60205.1 hypothetical prote|eukprot:XP_001347961.1 conserved Plasmodium protein, unknown function [Plasmodium falciparum 3D7]
MWNLINYNNENDSNANATFWSIFGYEDKPNENISINENEQKENNLKVEKNIEPELLDENTNKDIRRKKKKKKNKLKDNIDKSPFLSDISAYADYCTSDDVTDKYSLNENNDQMISSESNRRNYSNDISEKDDLTIQEEKEIIIEKENDLTVQEENDITIQEEKELIGEKYNDMTVQEEKELIDEKENDLTVQENKTERMVEENYNNSSLPYANEWLFDKIKEILDPSINQESISELLTHKYNSFNEANTGIFDLLENLLVRSGSNNQENMEISKQKKGNYSYNHYNSMDESINEHYNFINYSIHCINKELSANVELEATKMMKIYNHSLNKYKNLINFKDDIYQDLVNEGEEISTLIFDENKKIKKRIPKIDFLVLININSDNYNNIIESHNVQTPKLNLEEIFKINLI